MPVQYRIRAHTLNQLERQLLIRGGKSDAANRSTDAEISTAHAIGSKILPSLQGTLACGKGEPTKPVSKEEWFPAKLNSNPLTRREVMDVANGLPTFMNLPGTTSLPFNLNLSNAGGLPRTVRLPSYAGMSNNAKDDGSTNNTNSDLDDSSSSSENA
jgi:hypothetical protein